MKLNSHENPPTHTHTAAMRLDSTPPRGTHHRCTTPPPKHVLSLLAQSPQVEAELVFVELQRPTAREHGLYQRLEQGKVISDKLRRHGVVDGSQQHLHFPFLRAHIDGLGVRAAVGGSNQRITGVPVEQLLLLLLKALHAATLEVACRHQDALEGSEAEVVVGLGGQLVVAQGEQKHRLAGKPFGGVEALREQHDLGDEVPVRLDHGDAAEELLEVIRKLRSPSVVWVHRDEDADVGVELCRNKTR